MKILKIIILISLFMAITVRAGDDKAVYLTFDGDMTYHMLREQKAGIIKRWYDPELIDYLIENHIPATFFLTGLFAKTYPGLMKKIIAADNFAIENHTYDHSSFEPNCFNLPVVRSEQQKSDEIERTQAALYLLTGRKPSYFRYPGLCHTEHDDELVHSYGLTILSKEIASGDTFLKSPDAIAKNVIHHIGQGNVFVFHLGNSRTPATLPALKILIPELLKAGYSLKHF